MKKILLLSHYVEAAGEAYIIVLLEYRCVIVQLQDFNQNDGTLNLAYHKILDKAIANVPKNDLIRPLKFPRTFCVEKKNLRLSRVIILADANFNSWKT